MNALTELSDRAANDPPAFDLLYWNADTTRLPARLRGDFLDLLLHNPLPRPGSLTIAGTQTATH
jgi:polyhydroxyalkanoate synthase